MPGSFLLIDQYDMETRVAVVKDGCLDDFDCELTSTKSQKGNVYLGRVMRVEPSLQAVFVDYGHQRHGFLAFSEIHPENYQIKNKSSVPPLVPDSLLVGPAYPLNAEEADPSLSVGLGEGDETSEVVDPEDLPKPKPVQGFRVQDVIKKNQPIVVQVVKDPRGTKGAALTTYISLPGRYGILLPNTPASSGISKKITTAASRDALKDIVASLSVPQSMSLIIRTAGEDRRKSEIKRDYDYLVRLWRDIQDKSALKDKAGPQGGASAQHPSAQHSGGLQGSLVPNALAQKPSIQTWPEVTPHLIYEEHDLLLRALRDGYSRDIDEVLIQGEAAFKKARAFMRVFMPSHSKRISLYTNPAQPLFEAHGVEEAIASIYDPVVRLPSGGSLVINVTEALVAVDVNSGKATQERTIEETAYKTNIEAARAIARQLKLRDLAGLIVIDFIDLPAHRRGDVEKALKEALKADRARIKLGKISAFGLLEMSRQRLRQSLVESSTAHCQSCGGTGRVPCPANQALKILRELDKRAAVLMSGSPNVADPASGDLALTSAHLGNQALGEGKAADWARSAEVAPAPQLAGTGSMDLISFLLNEQRAGLTHIEQKYGITVRLTVDSSLPLGQFIWQGEGGGEGLVAHTANGGRDAGRETDKGAGKTHAKPHGNGKDSTKGIGKGSGRDDGKGNAKGPGNSRKKGDSKGSGMGRAKDTINAYASAPAKGQLNAHENFQTGDLAESTAGAHKAPFGKTDAGKPRGGQTEAGKTGRLTEETFSRNSSGAASGTSGSRSASGADSSPGRPDRSREGAVADPRADRVSFERSLATRPLQGSLVVGEPDASALARSEKTKPSPQSKDFRHDRSQGSVLREESPTRDLAKYDRGKSQSGSQYKDSFSQKEESVSLKALSQPTSQDVSPLGFGRPDRPVADVIAFTPRKSLGTGDAHSGDKTSQDLAGKPTDRPFGGSEAGSESDLFAQVGENSRKKAGAVSESGAPQASLSDQGSGGSGRRRRRRRGGKPSVMAAVSPASVSEAQVDLNSGSGRAVQASPSRGAAPQALPSPQQDASRGRRLDSGQKHSQSRNQSSANSSSRSGHQSRREVPGEPVASPGRLLESLVIAGGDSGTRSHQPGPRPEAGAARGSTAGGSTAANLPGARAKDPSTSAHPVPAASAALANPEAAEQRGPSRGDTRTKAEDGFVAGFTIQPPRGASAQTQPGSDDLRPAGSGRPRTRRSQPPKQAGASTVNQVSDDTSQPTGAPTSNLARSNSVGSKPPKPRQVGSNRGRTNRAGTGRSGLGEPGGHQAAQDRKETDTEVQAGIQIKGQKKVAQAILQTDSVPASVPGFDAAAVQSMATQSPAAPALSAQIPSVPAAAKKTPKTSDQGGAPDQDGVPKALQQRPAQEPTRAKPRPRRRISQETSAQGPASQGKSSQGVSSQKSATQKIAVNKPSALGPSSAEKASVRVSAPRSGRAPSQGSSPPAVQAVGQSSGAPSPASGGQGGGAPGHGPEETSPQTKPRARRRSPSARPDQPK